MGVVIGAKTIDLEWVQVHPTRLVKPDDPDAKIKFLAAEALRGVGGVVFDALGNRFANELGRRDYVTGEMWKNKSPFRLALNKAASDEIVWDCKHCTGRGMMKFYESCATLAQDMGVSVSLMEESIEADYQASLKAAADPDGGPFPPYPSGKSWDEASGKTCSGKKFFNNAMSGVDFTAQPYYVAMVVGWTTPSRLQRQILSVPREVTLTPQQTELVTCRVAKWAFLRAESSITRTCLPTASKPMVIVVLHRRSACWSFSLKFREPGKAQRRSD